MSPIATARRLIPPYLAAAAPLTLLLAAMLRLSPQTTWRGAFAVAVPAAAMYALVCITVKYPVRGLPAGKAPASRILTVHLMGAVFATALWLGLLRLWVEILGQTRPFVDLPNAFRIQVPLLGGVGLLLYLLAVTFHSMLQAVDRTREAERRALELGLVARESELTLLRSQVDPHFLFNALNSIAGLTHSDPDVARSLCLRLGGFLRAGLRTGRQQRIPFRDELALSRDFLGIEKVRFGARLRIEEEIEEASLDCRVPPLILQPLLENAVRHGIDGLVKGGLLRLEARMTGSCLSIVVENERDTDAPSRRGDGIGLANVRRRLRALYGGAGVLSLSSTQSSFRAELRIPTHLQSTQDDTAPQEEGS